MKLDQGKDDVKSMVGSLCSIILLIVVAGYVYLKTDVLISKKDVDILSTVNDLHFTPDDVFNYENGLNFAVALTSY